MFKTNSIAILAAVTIALTGVSGVALADTDLLPHEKMQPVATSVAEILQDNHNSKRVSLRGKITKQQAKGKFIFDDDSGEIQLDIDSDLTDKDPITPPVEAELIGEVDKGIISETEIDVKSYKLLP